MRLGMRRTRLVVFIETVLLFSLLFSVFNPKLYWLGLLSWASIYLTQSRFGNFSFLGIFMLPVSILLFTLISLKAVGESVMKQKIVWRNRTYLQCLLGFLLAFGVSRSWAAPVQLQLTNLRNGNGAIAISVFAEENASSFPEESSKAAKTFYIELKGNKEISIDLGDLPSGVYAASLLHDENGNKKLDSAMGVPKEGFGFTNNPTVYFGPPSFSKCRFEIKSESMTIHIKMKYLL